MGRPLRTAQGGFVYHVLNRANDRKTIFQKASDYEAFGRLMAEVQERVPMRILAWCLMPNHWHLLLWPERDGQLSDYVRLLTLTHTQRWHAHYHSAGSGHLYQGRFKSFLVESDMYLLTVCRYVEQNPLRARLVTRAEDWRWSSLWEYCNGWSTGQACVTHFPIDRPARWVEWVNQLPTDQELEAVRNCATRGAPYGSASWVETTAKRLGIESTLRPRGRPKKSSKGLRKGS